jgi:inhibitor of cysteine peptidase
MNSPAVYRDPAVPVDVRRGTMFSIVLESNASTGYAWQIAQPLDASVVETLGSEYHPPSIPMPGAAGSEEWSFRAAGVGHTTIAFGYARPWEQDTAPAEIATFQVVVQE